jgi:hypothetical protein
MTTRITFTADDATFAGIQARVATISNLTCTWESDGEVRTVVGEVMNPFPNQVFDGMGAYQQSRFGGLERYITISGGQSVVRSDGP